MDYETIYAIGFWVFVVLLFSISLRYLLPLFLIFALIVFLSSGC